MPIVNVQITREGATREQKAELIAEITGLLKRVLNKDPATTMVVIDEIEPDNWGVMGLPTPAYRQQRRDRTASPSTFGDSGTPERLVAAAVGAFGGIDVLVNSAGAFAVKSFVDSARPTSTISLSTNLRGTFLVTQAVVRQMKAQGRGGAIVNVTASIATRGWTAIPATAASATKGALNTITSNLAIELARDDIRVNAVAPGLIKTPLHGRTDEQFTELNGLQPLGRVGTTKDVVEAILYLADADFTTGAILPVDGGVTAGHW